MVSMITALFLSLPVQGGQEIGPEGHKLLYFLLVVVVVFAGIFFVNRIRGKKGYTRFREVRKNPEVEVELYKNSSGPAESLTMTLRNTGQVDVEIERPLMVFSKLFSRRSFRLKGTENYQVYPFYLESGKIHSLRIDLNSFYRHDKRLIRYPRVTVIVSSVNGNNLGRKSIMLGRALFL